MMLCVVSWRREWVVGPRICSMTCDKQYIYLRKLGKISCASSYKSCNRGIQGKRLKTMYTSLETKEYK